MDQEQDMVFLGDNTSLIVLEWPEGHTINEPREDAYFLAYIPIVFLTIFANLIAVVVIRKKDSNRLNDLIVLDCMMNVVSMIFFIFKQSPWFIMKSTPLCLVYHFINIAVLLWTRLVPVGIAFFRYLMVCHAVFSHNRGGEESLMKMVKRSIMFLSLLTGGIFVIEADKSKTHLRCIGRTEIFR